MTRETSSFQPGPSDGGFVPRRIAIVGAGVAGLTCGQRRAAEGHRVEVFDKGRGPGGRLATRRRGAHAFDHGAQYFTARDASFRAAVEAWRAAGCVAAWEPIETVERPSARAESRLVGTPGMSAIGRRLAAGVPVRLGSTVAALVAADPDEGWAVRLEDGSEHGPYDRLVLAIPAPQARALLAAHASLAGFAAELEEVAIDPCWALLLGFAGRLSAAFDARRARQGPIAWAARNGSKPSRDGSESWVVHASPDWSREHLEEKPDRVAHALLAELPGFVGTEIPEPVFQQAHRWRYALVSQPLGSPFLLDRERGIGLCGDWCIAPRIEAAWTSGAELGAAMLGTLAPVRRPTT